MTIYIQKPMRPVQPCKNFLSTNARTNDLKKAPVPDEPWEVVGYVNNWESDDLRVRNQEARVCHPLCPAVLVIWLFIRVAQKNQKSEFWYATNPSGFHRLDEPPKKISAL